MGAIELRPDADFSGLGLGYIPPVLDGLVYWGWLGGSLAQSRRNYAPGMGDGSIMGAPGVHDGYLSLEGDSTWLDTLQLEEATITACMVARATGALTTTADNQEESAYFLSNQADVSAVDPARNSAGLSIYSLRSNQVSVRGQAWNGTALVTGNVNYALDPMSWSYFDLTFEATGALSHSRMFRNKTQNFSVSATSASAREPNVRPLRVGDAASVNSGKIDAAFVALYHRALSVEEKDLIYSVVKQVCALPSRGAIAV